MNTESSQATREDMNHYLR